MAPDPTNRADLPPSWLPEATAVPPKPPAYQHAVARTVKNRQHTLVIDMAEVAEDLLREKRMSAEVLEGFDLTWWRKLARAAGHDSKKPPSPETRAEVVKKVRENLAAPYRAKGRG